MERGRKGREVEEESEHGNFKCTQGQGGEGVEREKSGGREESKRETTWNVLRHVTSHYLIVLPSATRL